MASISLQPGREKSLNRRHPWIFSGAIDRVEGYPKLGETVKIYSRSKECLGNGAFSPHSQIRVRMWSFNPEEDVSPEFFQQRLQSAIALRTKLQLQSAYRIVNSESDGLPGLIIDRYEDYLVCQFLSAGAEFWKKTIIDQLQNITHAKGIFERSDVDVRQKEGLKPMVGVLAGQAPPELIEIQEGSTRYYVDVYHGHKTGFYLDQRDNRILTADFTKDKNVLNCFSYTGAFGIWALYGGAKNVTNIDSSATVLKLGRLHLNLNQFSEDKFEDIQADVFQTLRLFNQQERKFDVIILDPPKLVDSQDHLIKASRAYKDMNRLAFQLLAPEGTLITFSCSGLMPVDLFQKIVFEAEIEAHREVQIIKVLRQSSDHPVSLNFPEGSYLKGLVCRVL
jgi:23S rRNA (cytosine1962-C5)-methyltransferase